jgi:hypothetical protein
MIAAAALMIALVVWAALSAARLMVRGLLVLVISAVLAQATMMRASSALNGE